MGGMDLYVRITHTRTGHTWVRQCRVWDSIKFFDAETERQNKEGFVVKVVDRAEYITSRKRV